MTWPKQFYGFIPFKYKISFDLFRYLRDITTICMDIDAPKTKLLNVGSHNK